MERLYDGPQLKVDNDLNRIAKNYVWGSCLNDSSLFKEGHNVEYHGARYHLVYGYIIVRKMYDKFMLFYNWNAKGYKGKYDEYAQIVWKSTRKVGVGVCVRYTNIYVVITFLPKGCTKKSSKNVRPINPSHIHMFGFLEEMSKEILKSKIQNFIKFLNFF
uniref:SCP domain-containing protein n=1 Tax=Strongyloides venezuelensis TaxID=75913 RepID=A0A0K0FJB3_STRVS